MLSKEQLNELFEYRDGMLFWKVTRGTKVKKGCRAGHTKDRGYRQIGIHGQLHSEHRMIWTMHNGDIPTGMLIDHEDRNPRNNKIDNLRLATQPQNCHNTKMHKDNICGHKGIEWHSASQTFRVKVMAMGKTKHRHYHSLEAARIGHRELATQMHGSFANFG